MSSQNLIKEINTGRRIYSHLRLCGFIVSKMYIITYAAKFSALSAHQYHLHVKAPAFIGFYD